MAWTTAYNPITKSQIKPVAVDGLTTTYQMSLPNWGDLTFTDKDGNQSTWSLQQFQHRSPSEHYYDADQRRLELHFVHYQKVGSSVSDTAQTILSISFEASGNG
eukprot:TRINITY_DN27718_c0_g1_i1.p2 TRINITY_DN27718_c0_g1~~TRINITY_DN27718_c0_g1_i1.p2  ORF type:complete len:104 (+),score=10.34 TRINITY_DN27718_c0_g1_i1:211-522(+)